MHTEPVLISVPRKARRSVGVTSSGAACAIHEIIHVRPAAERFHVRGLGEGPRRRPLTRWSYARSNAITSAWR